MKTVLITKIPVVSYTTFAEVASMERRPELGVLCRAAMEPNRRITPAVIQSVLPGIGETGAENIIRWAQMLGICDRNGGITALAEDVAETDEVPVPEQGTYRFWVVQHPLLGKRFLSMERVSSTRHPRTEEIKPIPVEPDTGKLFVSVLSANDRFMVKGFPSNHGQKGCIVQHSNASCTLRWTLDFNAENDTWQLEGMIESREGKGKQTLKPIQHNPESDGLDLWKLVEHWAREELANFGVWEAADRRLAVDFQRLNRDEIDTFKKLLQLKSVRVPGKGEFKNVRLEQTPIGPLNQKEAQIWADDRFTHRLTAEPSYRSRSEVRDLFSDLTEDTPLEKYSPQLLYHHELADQFSDRPEVYWSIVAPVDLSPRPVEPSLLAGLTVGAEQENSESTQIPNVVRIPYRGGWSMRQLVDELLQGEIPARVLLCDRYVRGNKNLKMLKLLAEALIAVNQDVILDVWTEEKDSNLEAIKQTTGRTAKSYNTVFANNAPHDRYMVLSTKSGDGFGWHMSNSPLDPRSDVPDPTVGTPLRWRDFSATRVLPEGVLPALRNWIKGEVN